MCQEAAIEDHTSSHTPAAPDPEAAQAMIDAFSSVGVNQIDQVYTGGGRDLEYFHDLEVRDLKRWIAKKLNWAAKQRRNVIVRPHRPSGVILLQLDDLNRDALDSLRSAAFLGVETSLGSFQAWIALAGPNDHDFARRLKLGLGADLGASGAGRIAGSINFKEKYAPNYPRIELVHTSPGLITSRVELEAVVAIPPPGSEPTLVSGHPPRRPATTDQIHPPAGLALADMVVPVGRTRRGPHRWPNYQRCLDHGQMNRDGNGLDRSRADFFWCMLAIQWGWGLEDTADQLMELSEKAQENGYEYALRTAGNAAAAVERDSHKND